MRPLSTLIPGERAVVARIDIPPEQRGRLMEMGLLPGTSVELVRFAPLGDPVEIKLRNYHLSLRKHEAEKILVR
jgi:Fe2+ transport system protein FeoA